MGIAYDERTGRVTVVSVIDNMMKGAGWASNSKCKHNSGTRRNNRFTTYAALSIRGDMMIKVASITKVENGSIVTQKVSRPLALQLV